jgi:hypothetical protein
MAIKMGVSKDQLEGFKPVPNGVYQIRLEGFDPQKSQKGDSVNLNPIMKIVNHPQYSGQRIFWNCNTKAAFLWPDFAHAFGLDIVMEGDEVCLPGGSQAWTAKPGTDENDPKNWIYRGLLLGKVGKVEVVEEHKQGQKPRNNIKMFICAIPDCATKNPNVSHVPNMIK